MEAFTPKWTKELMAFELIARINVLLNWFQIEKKKLKIVK